MIRQAPTRDRTSRAGRCSQRPRRISLMFAALGLWLALPGCYGMKILRSPVNTSQTREDVQAIKQRQQEIMKRIDELEQMITEQEKYSRESTAASHAKLDDMLAELEYLRTQTQESTDRMGQFTRRVETATWQSAQPDTLRPKAGSEGEPMTGALPDELYDTAYLDVTRGNYSLAIDGFQEYLESYPGSELADNAQYWIGQCYYEQRDFFKAIEEFGKVLDLYPHGDKVPAAMIKLGMSYLQVSDRASAKKIFRQVVDLYPHTDEASIARDQLAGLN